MVTWELFSELKIEDWKGFEQNRKAEITNFCEAHYERKG